MVKKRGDTLIEVSLAIGIFSLVAIAVVAVVSGSTSAAQSALEVTITREEIDAQAEALRFIHTSYIAGGSSNLAGNDKYARLWNNIVENAIDLTKLSDDDKKEVLNYNPSECGSIYNSDKEGNNYLNRHGAFVVNTRSLGLDYDKSNKIFVDASGDEVSLGKIIVRPSIDEGVGLFRQAATYPRIIYGNVDSGSLLDDADGSAFINAVEGIFVIAVKDADSTTIVESGKQAAYYDFYIRTCWFEPGAERPSTISTVIRLQDPEVIKFEKAAKKHDIDLKLNGNSNYFGEEHIYGYATNDRVELDQYKEDFKWGSDVTNKCPNVKLAGWAEGEDRRLAKPSDITSGKIGYYAADGTITLNHDTTLYAIWDTGGCSFWFDVNVFLKGDSYTDTSGRDGFNIEVRVNGKLISEKSQVNWWDWPVTINGNSRSPVVNSLDWYSMTPLGSKITATLYGRKDTCIVDGSGNCINSSYKNICSIEDACRVVSINLNSEKPVYIVELEVLPGFMSNKLDSSGNYSVQLEPYWGCRPNKPNCTLK